MRTFSHVKTTQDVVLATGVQTAGRLGIAKGLFVMVISVVCFEAVVSEHCNGKSTTFRLTFPY